MIAGILKLITVIFTAAVAENALFGRAFLTRKMLFPMRKLEIAVFSVVITLLAAVSGFFCYFFDIYLLYPNGVPLYLRSVLYLAVIAAVHTGLSYLASRHVGRNYELIRNVVLLAGFNAAVLGTVLLCSINRFTLLERLAYFAGTGIGVTMSLILINVGKQDMMTSNVPRAFRGLPITLIYIGILSLAIYGLIGHQLPY